MVAQWIRVLDYAKELLAHLILIRPDAIVKSLKVMDKANISNLLKLLFLFYYSCSKNLNNSI